MLWGDLNLRSNPLGQVINAFEKEIVVDTEKTEPPEKQILRLAKKHRGILTVQMVAMETSLSLQQSQQELNGLRAAAFCELDVDEDGVEIFRFKGLEAKRPVMDV